MRRALQFAIGIALLLAPALPTTAEDGSARVTYVTASSVYLDAGEGQGLAVGAQLELMRGERVIARIEVVEVSARRAVAKVLSQTEVPTIGDQAAFSISRPDPVAQQQTAPTTTSFRRRRDNGIHGRIGVRHLSIDDAASANGGFSRTSLDLRVDGEQLPGTPWGFDVDLRARRTYRNDPTLADRSSTRAYRLLVSRGHHDAGLRFAAGRQLSPHLASINVFDGISADYNTPRWGVGLVSGTQPDVEDFGYSSAVTEHGAYFRFKATPNAKRHWDLVTGAIASYAGSEINREFLFFLSRYRTRRVWAYASQEVDYNRDWKVDEAGEDSLAPTSTFLSVNIRASESVNIRAGYDNRRNVRLARDRVTPATDFDDSFRRGAWVGAQFRLQRRLRLGFDTRINSSGPAGSSETFGLQFSGHGFTSTNLAFGTRVDRYTNDQIEGWFYEIDTSVNVADAVRLRAYAGRRDDTNLTSLPPSDTLDWFGLSVDLYLGRRWYATLEAEDTRGTLDDFTQYFATMSYRF